MTDVVALLLLLVLLPQKSMCQISVVTDVVALLLSLVLLPQEPMSVKYQLRQTLLLSLVLLFPLS